MYMILSVGRPCPDVIPCKVVSAGVSALRFRLVTAILDGLAVRLHTGQISAEVPPLKLRFPDAISTVQYD